MLYDDTWWPRQMDNRDAFMIFFNDKRRYHPVAINCGRPALEAWFPPWLIAITANYRRWKRLREAERRVAAKLAMHELGDEAGAYQIRKHVETTQADLINKMADHYVAISTLTKIARDYYDSIYNKFNAFPNVELRSWGVLHLPGKLPCGIWNAMEWESAVNRYNDSDGARSLPRKRAEEISEIHVMLGKYARILAPPLR